MSTQKDDGISFSLLPEEEREHFRMLELPPELLQHIMSNQSTTLHFKSPQEPTRSGVDTEAVLCTADKTYNIRQVNTSNSVYICQSINGDNGDGIPQAGLQAIAQSSWTLELNQSPPADAQLYLMALLPTYSSGGAYQSKDLHSDKRELFDHVPLSDAECEDTWKSMVAFQLSEPKGCFLPTVSAKVQAWRSILDTAVAKGIDLTNNYSPIAGESVIDSDEDWPVELGIAVAVSMTNGEGILEQSKCVVSVGLSLLKMKLRLPVSEFLGLWKNSLPEKWRSQAKLDALPASMFALLEHGKVIAYPIQGEASYGTAADSKPASGTKRKWHDKFRASKKTS